MTKSTPKTPGSRLLGDVMELTPLQYVVLFARIYVALWGVSAAGWFAWRVMCFGTFADVEWLLDFKLPDVMFNRPALKMKEYRSEQVDYLWRK